MCNLGKQGIDHTGNGSDMARSKTSNFFVWIVIGLLFVGLIGFGATGLSGNIRSIGSVGDKELDLQTYANQLNQEIRAFEAQTGSSVSFPEAQTIGLDRAVLARVIGVRALDNEAAQVGLSVGDARVRAQILEIPSFRGPSGEFDRDAYRFSLGNNGLTEATFETQLREEMARTVLQGAVLTGVEASDTYAETLSGYIGESRDFTWVRLSQADLETELTAATDEQLLDYYQANPIDFTEPAKKRLTYVSLTPEMIVDTVEIDETALQDLYNTRLDTFVQPERRLVERLVFSSQEDADAAAARLTEGEIKFDALVEERGLALSDIDLGDLAQPELGDAGDAVFAAQTGDVVGPLPTDLGPALFRMNAILSAQETTYEQALPELREELATERARRIIDDASREIDDLLVGGATLEEVAAETEMVLGQIDWFAGSEEIIAGYDNFRAAANAVTSNDFPDIERFEDGGLFALRLDETIDAELVPLEDIRGKVVAGWETQETSRLLNEQAQGLIDQVNEGRTLVSLGVEANVETGMTRTDFIAGAPGQMLPSVFALDVGGSEILEAFGAVYLVRLDVIGAADTEGEEATARLDLLSQQAEQGIAQDLLDAYSRAVQAKAGIELNQAALNAVHAQFQSGGAGGHGY